MIGGWPLIFAIAFGLIGLFFNGKLNNTLLIRYERDIDGRFPPIRLIRRDISLELIAGNSAYNSLMSGCFGAAAMAVLFMLMGY